MNMPRIRSGLATAAMISLFAAQADAASPAQAPQNALLNAHLNAPLNAPPSAPALRQAPPEQKVPKKDAASPIVEKLAPGIFRMGQITIDKNLRCVMFPASVNMEKGLLEYMLVREGGKTHESLLRTAIDPYDLQLAFLLLGFEGADHPLLRQGDPQRPKGESVEISVVLKGADGKSTRLNPEEWIEKRSGDASSSAGKLEMVFTGSVVRNNRFIAQAEGSVIALYHDPVALIDNASPGGESDKVWFVRSGKIPPAGTPVTVAVRSLKRP